MTSFGNFGRWPPYPWGAGATRRPAGPPDPIAPVLELDPKAWFRADYVQTAGESVSSMVGLVGTEGVLTVTEGSAGLGSSPSNNDRPYVNLQGLLTSDRAPAFWDFMLSNAASLFAVYTVADGAVNIGGTTDNDWSLTSDLATELIRLRIGAAGEYADQEPGGGFYSQFDGDLCLFYSVASPLGGPWGSIGVTLGSFPVGTPSMSNGGEFQLEPPGASVGTFQCGSSSGVDSLRLSELIFFDRAVDMDAEITVITGYLIERYRQP